MTKKIARRTLLRGAGVALSLPWLESISQGRSGFRSRDFVRAAAAHDVHVHAERRAAGALDSARAMAKTTRSRRTSSRSRV